MRWGARGGKLGAAGGGRGARGVWTKPDLRHAAIGPLLHAGELQTVLKRTRIVRCEPVARALHRWRQVSQQQLQMRHLLESHDSDGGASAQAAAAGAHFSETILVHELSHEPSVTDVCGPC
jgi:hypothetical protein